MPEHESGKVVTLRMLLTHTSGINRPGNGIWHEGDVFPTLKQVLNGEYPATSEKVKFIYEPGTKHSYSNHGYLILQQIIEDYYGKTYTEVVEENIFKPLKLTNSCIEYPLPDKIQKHFIKGHNEKGEPSDDDGLHPNALAQAGWMATPEDVALFGIELMKSWNGKSEKVISKKSIEKLMNTEVYLDYNFEGGIKQQGLGCLLYGYGDNKYFSHHGQNIPPGANCMLLGNPKTGNGLVIMTNGEYGYMPMLRLIPAIAEEYGWKNANN